MAIYSKNQLGEHAIVVKATGTVANDQALVSAAVSQLNTWGEGVLGIEGALKLNAQVSFTAPISVIGVGQNASIESTNQSEPIAWNRTWYYTDPTSYTMSMGGDFDESFQPAGVTPTRGDWVLLWASNALTGVPPHTAGGSQFPMEIHQVYHWISPNAYTEGPIIDYMSTTPKVAILSPSRGIRVENLHFAITSTYTPDDYGTFLMFRNCQDVVVENCTFDREGIGAVEFRACINARFHGNTLYGQDPEQGQYGIAVYAANGVTIEDNRMIGFRHAFTTVAEVSSGSNRWGTPLNVVVRNNVFDVPPVGTDSGLDTDATSIVSTHPEGHGLVIDSNTFNISGGPDGAAPNMLAIDIRSRSAVIKNNLFQGYQNAAGTATLGKGILLYGPNAEVRNNRFERMYDAVTTKIWIDFIDYSDGAVIEGNVFKDIRTCPVRLCAGDNHRVVQNDFVDCAIFTVSNPQITEAHVQLGALRQFTSTSFTNGTTTVTLTSHPFVADEPLFFTGGTLPSNLTANTTYWVVADTGADTFTIAATQGGAAITFASAGSGVTSHAYERAGTGVVVAQNTSIKGDNDNFIETNDLASATDIEVYGNVTAGYSGAAFSDRYSNRSVLQTQWESLNWGM